MENTSSIFSINSEANASEFIENIEEVFNWSRRNDYMTILKKYLSLKDQYSGSYLETVIVSCFAHIKKDLDTKFTAQPKLKN